MKLNSSSKTIISLYAVTVGFWLGLVIVVWHSLVGDETIQSLRLFTQIPLAVIPFVGGILGLQNAIAWGGKKSVMGRSSLFLSFGLITWASGMVAWNYYIFFTNIEVPYPSFADVGYVLGLFCFVMGISILAKAVGVKFALRNIQGKILLFVIPVVVSMISIYLLIDIARGGVLFDPSTGYLKLSFDLLYPLGDVVILTVTTLIYFLSKNILGGAYKTPVLVLFTGFCIFYISDFMFSYTTTIGTYFNGHLVDFLFTTAMFVLSLGLSMLSSNRNGNAISQRYDYS